MHCSSSAKRTLGAWFVFGTRKSAAGARSLLRRLARLRRQAWYEEVVELYRQGKSIAAIAQHLQMSPTTVRTFVYAGAFPERSAHRSRRIVRLEPYLPYLEQRFFKIVRERQADLLDDWLHECEKSEVPDLQTFAEGLKREYSAMKGALQFSYSNGPVEGQINTLKYIKRSMYGREKFALLYQRFLQAV